jgi:hypothetical protein
LVRFGFSYGENDLSVRRKNRKNILLFAIAAFWIAYVGIVSAEYYFNIASRVDQVIQNRKKDVDFVLEFSGNLIIKDNLDSLTERLKQAREFRKTIRMSSFKNM